ncbi:hypothetical protein GW796_09910 [archaeon]|nr:hypothetical protein [archaeon]
MIEINNQIKKRFCKDFSLPINVFDEPYFEYFVDLYDNLFNIKDKLVLLNNTLQNCNTQEDFFNKSFKLSDSVKELISNSQAYKNFNTVDLNDFPLLKNVSQQNVYIVPNIGQEMISIDLEKANFNSFRLFGLQDEIGCQTYSDLIKKFTEDEYYIQSKMIRQVIFGNLNPSRQQRIQKYVIQNLCIKLLENGCEISSASSDEIIVKNKTNISEVKEMLSDVDDKFKFFRVEKFHFDRVSDDFNYFLKSTTKENGEEKLEFKNTQSFMFAQVFKKQFNLPLNEYDMLFYHEGLLANFKELLFDTKLKHNLKL